MQVLHLYSIVNNGVTQRSAPHQFLLVPATYQAYLKTRRWMSLGINTYVWKYLKQFATCARCHLAFTNNRQMNMQIALLLSIVYSVLFSCVFSPYSNPKLYMKIHISGGQGHTIVYSFTRYGRAWCPLRPWFWQPYLISLDSNWIGRFKKPPI